MNSFTTVWLCSGMIRTFLFSLLISVLLPGTGHAATPTPEYIGEEVTLAPVVVDGVELFRVRGVSAFPAEKRAARIAARIRAVADDDTLSPNELSVIESEQFSRISLGGHDIMTVVDADAQLERLDRKTLAFAYVKRIAESIDAYRHNRSTGSLLRNALYALAASIALGLFLWLGGWAMRRIDLALDKRVKAKLEGLETQSKRIVSADDLWTALRGMRRLAWTIVVLVAVIVYLDYILHVFPWTRHVGVRLLTMVINPLRILAQGLLNVLPNLIFLVILIFLTRYLVKMIQLFFRGLARGSISVSGFEREWSWPTYRLVRLVVIAFAVVMAYPYIPGSQLDAFKGVSIFLGVIFSLGSTSVISNVVAGYSLIYRRAFRIGDRVKIDEHVGDVTQARLLVTHLRTPKNEEVIIPNSTVLNSSILNFSTLARDGRLILHTTVGIGYETPWRQVEAMLLQAAERTEGVAKDPSPFVLQKALGDFCVTYEINVFCADAQAMARLYSRLHQNILDVFNEFDVQIMTPAYERDPEQRKVVPRDQWYAAPANPKPQESNGSEGLKPAP